MSKEEFQKDLEQCVVAVIAEDLERNGPITQQVKKLIKENAVRSPEPSFVTNNGGRD